MSLRDVRARAATSALVAGAWLLAAPVPWGGGAAALAQEEDQEEILSYDVRVRVEAGGWLEITEQIRVRALGRDIRRGIYRDFPTSFPAQSGLGRVTAPFEVVRVLRDGQPETYVIQSVGGPAQRSGVRVRIGEPGRNVSHGEHTYTLTYRTARWVTFDEDADRLYWNVTGAWGFPILSASAVVSLPGPSDPPPGLEAWTGPVGSTATDATWSFDPDAGEFGTARFRTTNPLASGDGLTIRVTVPKGVIAPPTPEQEGAWRRADRGPARNAGLVVGLVLALYLLMWNRVGVDPAARPLTVQYDPPEGFSPAALGYLERRGYHGSQLTAALVSLAVKGAVRIDRDDGGWTLHRTASGTGSLPKEEQHLLRELLPKKGRMLAVRGDSNPRVRQGLKALRRSLKTQLETHYFVTNRRWFAAGLALTIVGFAVLAWRVRFSVQPPAWFLGFWLTFWTFGVATLLTRVAQQWKQAMSGDVLGWAGAILLTLFSVPFVVAEIVVGGVLWRMVPLHLLVTAATLGAINALFYHLLERPTLKGRGVLDRLEGFKAFLAATEGHRLDRLQPAGAPLQLFERFLPHAIALDVESAWAKRFEQALAAPGAADGSGVSWYRGSGGDSVSSLTSSLAGAFASSLSSSSAPPRSSGGGGGGSSGGGGGGGGGGGW